MRAVRFHGREDIRLDEVEEPVCGSGQVKIKSAFVGICGSDLHEYLTGPHSVPVHPHPLTGEKLPTALGHEFSGTVEEIGDGVNGLKIGDKVAVKPNLSDDTCRRCLMGRNNCCDSLGFIGYSGSAGGLSDYVVVNEKHAIHLPELIPLDIGALVEPLSVAWHAVSRSPLQPDDTVLIVGAGPIGLAIVQVLKARGIDTIVVVEISARRREFAQTFGASHTLNPKEVDAVAEIRAITGEHRGTSIAFECSGVQAGLDTVMAGLRVRGTAVVVSLWEGKPSIDAFIEIVLGEKYITGAAIYDLGDFNAVIEAIASGKIKPQPMITSRIRMDEVAEKGFRALINEKDKHVKILIDMSA
ncbi:hypothetical protein N7448_009370 [Penicillium atrosanguineum]|uniref:Enoyl reductase (ER) domain-containing protein n=1 Tax=Penicillium atrosanguineum TaxID=1132637 RepID=A0A9W9GKE4_9EURO|nr:hypothetical protein N7448_009370 [Penicillium atrosanguineum]KAJ5141904.1 hypothetical protein N7526_002899 [Penicillium atrosanguineum]KAJ5321234.1 hypothetical protein N7476_004236 [Penicillium atrosanguineum]